MHDNGDMELDSTMMAAIEQEISEFEEWHYQLQEDLKYLMGLPATEENVQKLGSLVDYYFSDILFKHDDHDVHVSRTDDGGIAITVFMEYANPNDYYVDFGLDHDVDFEIRIKQPTEDDLWRVLDDMKLKPEDQKELENQVHANLIRMIEERAHEQAALEAHAQMEAWHHAVMAERAHMAAMGNVPVTSSSSEDEAKTESPDDILFAPILTDEEKKKREQQKVDETTVYDCGDD